jgi:hypothetical protein
MREYEHEQYEHCKRSRATDQMCTKIQPLVSVKDIMRTAAPGGQKP